MLDNKLPKLTYNGESKSIALIVSESELQTVTAESWLEISGERLQPEGLTFDRERNPLLYEVFGEKIFEVNLLSKDISVAFQSEKQNPVVIKIHKGGRLFTCHLGDFESTGGIFITNEHGEYSEDIISDINTDYCTDDMVFDSKDGFYFTDFRGYSTDLKGGVYYVSPDFKTVTPAIQNISVANGVALSTDEKVLWVTETTTNRPHRTQSEDDGMIAAPLGVTIPHHFTGHEGPDSVCIDSDDNLYVTMYGQGRVLVLNKRGYPIGQISMPGRDEGKMLRFAHPQFTPGINQLLMRTNDIENNPEGGLVIHTVEGLAKGHESYRFRS